MKYITLLISLCLIPQLVFAKGPALVFKGTIADFKYTPEKEASFTFTGKVRLESKNMKLSTEVKDMKVDANFMFVQETLCPNSKLSSRAMMDCLNSKDLFFTAPISQVSFRGDKIEAVKSTSYLVFEQMGQYPYPDKP